VLGDADQLQQVLANLLTNARQALEHRPAPRRLRIAARAAEGGAVEITAADNGPGVAAAARGRVFDPFFTTKPVGSGTGIGLAVSRGIAEAHGGSLTLEDAAEEGGGARFVLRLPKATPGGTAPDQPLLPPATASIEGGARSALIVDDEADVARVLAGMLAAAGFRCDLAAGGSEAQALLSKRDYDAILCDLRMPGMDGEALLAWMATEQPHLRARTAFVTGDALGQAAGGFLAGSGRPVLEKPFLPEEVHRLVAALVAAGEAGDR
jgi:CheY-like chemotaxis protein